MFRSEAAVNVRILSGRAAAEPMYVSETARGNNGPFRWLGDSLTAVKGNKKNGPAARNLARATRQTLEPQQQ